MGLQDGRNMNPQQQYELRLEVVRLREEGRSNKEISERVGLHPTRVSTIWQKYVKDGLDALKPKVRGRKDGEKRKLTAEQESQIRNLVINETPNEIGLGFQLWTRDAIRLAIRQEMGVELPPRTINDYLYRWGFVPKKLNERANKKTQKKYQDWLNSDYPELVASSGKNNATIHWIDATEVMHNINIVMATSNQGKVRFMFHTDDLTEELFINFMTRLKGDCQRIVTDKILLILRGHKVYQGETVVLWLKRNKKWVDYYILDIGI